MEVREKIKKQGTDSNSRWEYEKDLQNPSGMASNLVAAILHKAHTDKNVVYWPGMRFEDFYDANIDFMKMLICSYKHYRTNEINYTIIKHGITDFIDRMEFVFKTV